MIDYSKLKIIAGDDGKAWLCYPVDTAFIENITALSAELYGQFRGLKYKVRTAEITRFRESLADSLRVA